MTIFNKENKTGNASDKLFFGEQLSIARYDVQKFQQFSLLNEKALGFFWRPTEVSLTKDIKDFRDLTNSEQHIFTSNLKRQTLLDSVQGRGPVSAFLPICSCPELENLIVTWTFFENIHSKSYTHIIQNLYPNPSVIFDEILEIQEIVDCASDISKYYDDLILYNNAQLFLYKNDNVYGHKKALWLCLNSINALEAVRFYVSFACSFAFAELKKMEGNAKIIKLICRDENIHCSITQKLIKLLPETDEDFKKIKSECSLQVKIIFEDVVEQEKKWADYLFKDGSMIGLNSDILKQYLEYISRKRMKFIDIECDYKISQNPLPWMDSWISGGSVQVAPQETQITSYVIGGIKNDINDDTFNGIEL